MPLPFRIRFRRTGQKATEAALTGDGRLFALGTRSIVDLVAPAGAEIRSDRIQVDVQHLRVLAVTGYPRTVAAGWLEPLVDEFDLPLELSVHIRPLQSGEVVRALGMQIAKLESSRRAQVRSGRISDPERDIALEDAERLRALLQRGEERVFSVSMYLLLRAPSGRSLDELTRRVEAQLDSLLAQSRVTLFEQERGLRSCLPEGRSCRCCGISIRARWPSRCP
jgi:hypothetical protein